MRGLAGRPGDGLVGAKCDLIDPSSLVVGGEDAMLAARIGGDQSAVVAARDYANTVRSAGEYRTCVNLGAVVAIVSREQQHFFAKNEHRRAAEKMNADDRRARSNPADPVRER